MTCADAGGCTALSLSGYQKYVYVGVKQTVGESEGARFEALLARVVACHVCVAVAAARAQEAAAAAPHVAQHAA